MTGQPAAGWQLLDALVYTAAGVALGVLVAVIIGRGRLPRIPDSPAALVEALNDST